MVWCDASDVAIGVALQAGGHTMEDAAWLREAADWRHVTARGSDQGPELSCSLADADLVAHDGFADSDWMAWQCCVKLVTHLSWRLSEAGSQALS